jgi:hypothetical protein
MAKLTSAVALAVIVTDCGFAPWTVQFVARPARATLCGPAATLSTVAVALTPIG